MCYKLQLATKVKVTILERSTGNKKIEEWSFLPNNWVYWLTDDGTAMIDKNFALLPFCAWNRVDLVRGIGDLVILNLVTRNPFWLRRSVVASQIIEKADRFDMNNLRIWNVPCSITVSDVGVVVRFRVKMSGIFDTSALIGLFLKYELFEE